MNRHTITLSSILVALSSWLVLATCFAGTVLTGDDWDDGQLHGWQGNTAWTKVSVVNTGGNPGGYLLSESQDDNPSYTLGAVNLEERYTGNFTAARVNKISFDLNLLSGHQKWIYLRFRYRDFSHNGWYYPLFTMKMPYGRWIHYEVTFDPNWTDAQAKAAGWEQEPISPSFAETLSDVYSFEIRLYSPGDANDTRLGIDNVRVYSESDEVAPISYRMEELPDRFSGWWYSQDEQGTGLALELQGRRLFAAWFVYDDTGRTVWYTTGGNMTDITHYSGDLLKWQGWPLGGAYERPAWEKAGTVSMELGNGVNGTGDTLQFFAAVEGATVSKSFTRFMDDFAPGDADTRGLTGWWYDPDYDGMGFFLSAQGGKMAMVWYNYREDGSPRWWTSSGPFAEGASSYTGSLDGWTGGQCPGCAYQVPVRTEGAGGNVTITFSGSDTATLEANGTTYRIERFDIPAF